MAKKKVTKKAAPKKKATAKKATAKKTTAKKVTAKKATAKKATPKKATAKKATAKKATPKKAAAKKAAPKKVTAKKVTAKKATAKKATPKKAAAKKAAPKKVAAKKVAAKKTTTKKAAPKSATAKKATTRKTVAKKAAPKKAVAKKAAPKKVTAKKATTRKTAAKKVVAKKTEPTLIKTYKNEEWKKLKQGGTTAKMYYMISNQGRIKSVNNTTKDEYLIKGTYTRGGYHQFNIKAKGEGRKTYYMHREVAKLFLGKKAKGQEMVCHKDGNKKNNRASNLMWASKEEWSKLHKKLGTYKDINRDRVTYSKLNETKVRGIKKALKAGKKTKTFLAQKYGVSITQINRIASGENWGDITI